MIPDNWKAQFAARAASRRENVRERRLVASDGADRVHVTRDGQELISFASNDYLGLASHEGVKAVALDTIARLGVGSGASRLITGTSSLHAALEQTLAAHYKHQSTLSFSSGYHCNTGVISALADTETIVFSDALNHASIIDGCRLARAETRVFPHRDYDALEKLLRGSQDGTRGLIVSDTLFSIDGDFADCERLLELAREHGALLLLDDAHGVGVIGENGAGVLEAHGLLKEDLPDQVLVAGTLSKALGSLGAFVVCAAVVREELVNSARSLIFSTGLSLPDTAAALASIEIAKSDEGRLLRARVTKHSARLRNTLRDLEMEGGGEAHIVPIWLGAEERALELHQALLEQGLLIPAIRPPTVPTGRSMLRISLSAAHSDANVTQLIAALHKIAPSR